MRRIGAIIQWINIKADCVIINETELRHELRDKNTKINNLMNSLSSNLNIKDLIVTQKIGAFAQQKIEQIFYMDASLQRL